VPAVLVTGPYCYTELQNKRFTDRTIKSNENIQCCCSQVYYTLTQCQSNELFLLFCAHNWDGYIDQENSYLFNSSSPVTKMNSEILWHQFYRRVTLGKCVCKPVHFTVFWLQEKAFTPIPPCFWWLALCLSWCIPPIFVGTALSAPCNWRPRSNWFVMPVQLIYKPHLTIYKHYITIDKQTWAQSYSPKDKKSKKFEPKLR